MSNPRISLEQWRSLLAVVDAGGYAQAASALHKSQSAVTYAVQKIEALLGVKVFEVVGRKAHLTPTGQVLYRRAKACWRKPARWRAPPPVWRQVGTGATARGGDHLSHVAAAAMLRSLRRRAAADSHRALRERAQRH